MAVTIGNSRVGNASRVAVGTEDTNYTLPNNSVEYVYAASVQISGGDRIDSGQNVTLQFRTGADSFATLSNASGAVRTGTVLTDQNAVTAGERLTTTAGTYTEGVEIEGTNSVGTQLNRTQNGVCECQWSLDFSNAPSGTTYDFQVVWVTKNSTDTFQYLSITTYTPVPPVLSTATVTNRRNTTATVGCTTDTPAEGTLYYYVSTSATPPTAANLKNGTGAVAFGNTTNPAAPQTFAVTGLTKGTTYYTHFIHNNTLGDSNILTSASWITTNFTQKVWRARAINEALTGTTWLAAENTAVGVDVTSGDATLRVRLGRENTITPDTGTTESMTFPQYRVNSGSWTDINIVTASRACSLTTTTAYDGSATGYVSDDTKRLTGHTGSILAGWAAEWTDNAYSHPNDNVTLAAVEEFEYAIVFNSANLADSDVVEIRINSTLVTDYTAYATFNITKGAAPVTGDTTYTTTISQTQVNNVNSNKSGSFAASLAAAITQILTGERSISFDTSLADALSANKASAANIQYALSLAESLDAVRDKNGIINFVSTFAKSSIATNDGLSNLLFDVIFANNMQSVKTTADSIVFNNTLSEIVNNVAIFTTNMNLILNLSEICNSAVSIIGDIIYDINNQQISNNTLAASSQLVELLNLSQTNTRGISTSANIQHILNLLKSSASNKVSEALSSLTISLAELQDATLASVIEGDTTFGTVFAKTTSVSAIRSSLLNVDLVVSQSEEIAKLLSGSATFSISLIGNQEYLNYAIFDDAVWSTTSNEFIFVDLTSVLLSEGNIKAASVTLTNTFGQTQTVGLIGEAAANILITLAQIQDAAYSSITHSADANLTFALTHTPSAVLDIIRQFTCSVNFSQLNSSQLLAVKDLLYTIAVSQSSSTVTVASKVMELTTTLTQDQSAAILATANINFDTSLQQLNNTIADLNTAISFLTNLTSNVDADTGVVGAIDFNINLLQTATVQGIVSSLIAFITSITDNYTKTAVLNEAINYLTTLSQQTINTKSTLENISLILSLSSDQEGSTGIVGILELITTFAQNQQVTVDYFEVLTVLLSLSDISNAFKDISGSSIFNVNLSQNQVNTLIKVLTAAFITTYNMVETGQVDAVALSTVALTLINILEGDQQGFVSGFLDFAVSLVQNNINTKTSFSSIDINTLLSQLNSAGKSFTAPISFNLTTQEVFDLDLIREGIIQFNTNYYKTSTNNKIARPSFSMDLTLLDINKADRNTLAQLLLGLNNSLSVRGDKILEAITNYAFSLGINIAYHILLSGTITLSTTFAKTDIVQLLGQANITFGHLLGLAALSGALRDANIQYSTITNISFNGFTIAFELITPDNRVFTVYFEDRTIIVKEEDRVITIFGKRDQTIN